MGFPNAGVPGRSSDEESDARGGVEVIDDDFDDATSGHGAERTRVVNTDSASKRHRGKYLASRAVKERRGAPYMVSDSDDSNSGSERHPSRAFKRRRVAPQAGVVVIDSDDYDD